MLGWRPCRPISCWESRTAVVCLVSPAESSITSPQSIIVACAALSWWRRPARQIRPSARPPSSTRNRRRRRRPTFCWAAQGPRCPQRESEPPGLPTPHWGFWNPTGPPLTPLGLPSPNWFPLSPCQVFYRVITNPAAVVYNCIVDTKNIWRWLHSFGKNTFCHTNTQGSIVTL